MPSLDKRLKTTTLILCPIQSCKHCDTRVDVSRYEPLQELTCPSCSNTFTVEGGLDRFTLVGLAGHGGTGTVYQATDPQLGRKIALKIVREDRSTDEEILAQLESEAQITASLNHPHVLRVFSVGRAQGRFYIAMELVQGGSLDDLLAKHPVLPEVQALEIAIQVASGLEAAHQAGLVHRDIKPGNILFSNAQTAKVVDFGLAIFEREAAKNTGGPIWGTPFYLSPERLDSEAEDFRSDIYSLGVVLFQMLTGRPPFDAGTPQEVAFKRLTHPAPSVLTYAPKVSNATAFVVKKMLEKDRQFRFQSYGELLENLKFARDGLGASGGAKVTRVVLDEAANRRAGMWITLAFALFVVACIAGVIWVRKSRAKDAVSPIPEIAAANPASVPAAPPARNERTNPPPANIAATKPAAKPAPTPPAPPATAAASAPVTPGLYRLKNRKTGQVVDVSKNNSNTDATVKTYRESGAAPNQRWLVRPVRDGWQIVASHSCKALEILAGSKEDGAPIRQGVVSGTEQQLWQIQPLAGGYYQLIAKCSGKALTLLDSSLASDAPLGQRSLNSSEEQQWKLEPCGALPPDLEKIIKGEPLGTPPPPITAKEGVDPKGTHFLPISLANVANCDSRKGALRSPQNDKETVRPLLTGWVDTAGVPFQVLNNATGNNGKDLLILNGGMGTPRESYPKRVEIPVAGAPRLTRLHFLSGVGGWGYPWDNTDKHLGTLAAQITVVRKGGSSQVMQLRNGIEFADFQSRVDVPGSAYVDRFADYGRQVRYFSKSLNSAEPVEKIILESFGTNVAPIFVALTAEVAP